MAHLFRALAVLAVVYVVNGAYDCPSGWKDQSGTPNCAGAVATTCSKTTCCGAVPTCNSFAVAWAVSQLLGQGCAADTKFFDLKKTNVEVANPQGNAEVKAACCTPFAQAHCSDWSTILGSCPSGQAFVGTNSAPPDGSDGKTLSKAKYQEMCCVTQVVPLKKCSYFAVPWAATQLLGLGCAPDTKFFDNKKADVEVANPAGDAEVKAACCTPFAQAHCSDWSAILGSCPSGQAFVGTNSAPADGGDGKTLGKAKYQEMCCITPPKKCSSFAVAWMASQLLGAGCAADTKFFDNKKADLVVAPPSRLLTSSTYTLVGNGACVDSAGSHGSGLLKFDKTTTSVDPHTNCQAACTADATCTGYDTRATGCLYYKIQIAKSNDALTTYQCYKKDAASSGGVTATAGVTANWDAQVKAACCTPFAQAHCSDWSAILGSCPSGKFFVGTNSAPADGSDGKTLSKAKYQQMCCLAPMKCADYTSTMTSSVSQATASLVAFVLAITAVMVA
jgi:hypothetical protein